MRPNNLLSPAARVGIAAAGEAQRDIRYLLAASPALFCGELSAISRDARCYLLMQRGSINLPLAPRMPGVVVIDPSQPIEAAAYRAFQECLDQIATNLVVVARLDDIEGAHQLRNGMKRLRVAFSAFAPALSVELTRLDGEVRKLGRQVGKLRDLDVAANTVLRQGVSASGDASMRDLGKRLLEMATDSRQRLRTILMRDRARGLLIDLAGLVDALFREKRTNTPPSVGLVNDLAGDVINLRWEAVRARVHRLDRNDVRQRHKLRKQVRNLRYTVELFKSLFPAAQTEPFLRGLKDMQTALGELSDAEMMRKILRSIEATCAGDRDMKRAIAHVSGTNATKAERGLIAARAIWADLTDTNAFWGRLI